MELLRSRTLELRAAVLAALSGLVIVLFAPPGGDSAAHLYRVELLRDGVALWDNHWFAGHYPLASYSLLYYLPASLVGNVAVVIAAVVAAAALFASIATREWGNAARWPALLFAVVVTTPLFTGTYSYAVGVTAALAALRALQARRTLVAVVCAALTLGFSPLAFVFLCLVLAAVAAARRPPRRRVLVVAAALAALAALQTAVVVAFETEGRYPFGDLSLVAVVGVSALGAALASRSDRGKLLAALFVLWALLAFVAYVVPSPFGDNLARLRTVVLPLVLLAAILAHFRPRVLAVAALAAALVYNVGPEASALPKRNADTPTAEAAFWAPALEFLRARSSANYRVEVVPTFGHWEAYWVPRAGFSLARGWYRQLDVADNPELYEDPLHPAAYRRWLRRMAVRYVLLPDARLDRLAGEREAALLLSGRSGLVEVARTGRWRIFELPRAVPLLTGPGAASLTRLGHDEIVGRVGERGAYRLRVRHSPYLRVAAGAVCIRRADDGTTTLVAARAGAFRLRWSLAGRSC